MNAYLLLKVDYMEFVAATMGRDLYEREDAVLAAFRSFGTAIPFRK